MIEVFCDGSPSPCELTSPMESILLEEPVGRGVVLIPDKDLGFIKRMKTSVVNKKGGVDSKSVEVFSIRMALTLCEELGLTEFVVYNDCTGAIEIVKDHRVEWRRRKQTRKPNDFFDKILGRGKYLRSTQDKVIKRKSVMPYQEEIYEFLKADEMKFKLSESSLWQRILKDEAKHPDAL